MDRQGIDRQEFDVAFLDSVNVDLYDEIVAEFLDGQQILLWEMAPAKPATGNAVSRRAQLVLVTRMPASRNDIELIQNKLKARVRLKGAFPAIPLKLE